MFSSETIFHLFFFFFFFFFIFCFLKYGIDLICSQINTIFSCFKFVSINALMSFQFFRIEGLDKFVYAVWSISVSLLDLIHLTGFQSVLCWCVMFFNINVSLVMVRK